jgi:5-methylcytosine-specific restriction endonuclease McrA
MPVRKRPTITAKTRLRILARDNFKCTNCRATPAIDPIVYLEIDHYVPFSHGVATTD